MKVTEAGLFSEDELPLKDYCEAITIYTHKEVGHKQAIVINPEVDSENLILCTQRLTQVLAKSLGMPYDKFMEMLRRSNNFAEKAEKLDLSEEQLKRMIEKDIQGFNVRM